MLKFIEKNIFLQVRIRFHFEYFNKKCFVYIDKSIVNEEDIKPTNIQDEDESETSFDDEQNSLLDRLGVKIDDNLHRIFTS